MIHHYFGTKEELFRESLAIPFDPTTEIPKIVAEGPENAGANLIRMVVRVWDSPLGSAGAAMIRSAMSNEWMTRLLREFLTTQILRKVVVELKLDPAEAPLRVSLVASQLAGLAMMRYIIKLEPLASLPVEELVHAMGPNVQRYITGSLDAAA
jgi:AcrR family transcriptional regulator